MILWKHHQSHAKAAHASDTNDAALGSTRRHSRLLLGACLAS
jgi:hypothetical protein